MVCDYGGFAIEFEIEQLSSPVVDVDCPSGNLSSIKQTTTKFANNKQPQKTLKIPSKTIKNH